MPTTTEYHSCLRHFLREANAWELGEGMLIVPNLQTPQESKATAHLFRPGSFNTANPAANDPRYHPNT